MGSGEWLLRGPGEGEGSGDVWVKGVGESQDAMSESSLVPRKELPLCAGLRMVKFLLQHRQVWMEKASPVHKGADRTAGVWCHGAVL